MRLQREIFSFWLSRKEHQETHLKIRLHPRLYQYIQESCKAEFSALGKQLNVNLQFVTDDNLHLETFKLEKVRD